MLPDEWDWYAMPVDGGRPTATGAGEPLRAAGLKGRLALYGERRSRVLAGALKGDRFNVWEVRLSPGSWRVQAAPRQLTYGAVHEIPGTISATGTVALTLTKFSSNFYFLSVSPANGQPNGPGRRLTQDGRQKFAFGTRGGDPGSTVEFIRPPARPAVRLCAHSSLRFLANRRRKTMLTLCRSLLAAPPANHVGTNAAGESDPPGEEAMAHRCPICTLGRMAVIQTLTAAEFALLPAPLVRDTS